MKIKLLKALPGASIGEIIEVGHERDYIGYEVYRIEILIQEGWAAEILKTVWDLKDGDGYVYIRSDGSKEFCTWQDTTRDEDRRKYNDCFLTEEEADMELLRRESRAKVWKPEEWENFWSIEPTGRAFDRIWEGDYIDMIYYHTGNTHKTKEEAIEWKAKYGKAFGLN